METSDDELSDDTESDITNPSFCRGQNTNTSLLLRQSNLSPMLIDDGRLDKIYTHQDIENDISYESAERKQNTIRFNLLPVGGANVLKSNTSPNCINFLPLSVNTTNNISSFNNCNNFVHSGNMNFHSSANLNVNNGFPWLHGENGMFPSPCSSSTTSSTLHDASGASHAVVATNGITSYNSNDFASNIFDDQTGNDLQTLPNPNKVQNFKLNKLFV